MQVLNNKLDTNLCNQCKLHLPTLMSENKPSHYIADAYQWSHWALY